ncbi:MAG: hypothetical protein WC545_02910 [Patescibacteria group bacterium]
MKRIIVIVVIIAALISAAEAQARYNRMNLEASYNRHSFTNPDFGKEDMMVVSGEWLPSFTKPNGIWGVIDSDLDRFAVGVYYSSTIESWRNMRISIDTAKTRSDFLAMDFGLAGLVNITEFPAIGDLTILVKTGPSLYLDTAWNKVLYKNFHQVYIDSVLDRTEYLGEEIRDYSASERNLAWDFSLKATRFNRESLWAFRNSLEVNYSTVLKSIVNNYTDSVLIGSSENQNSFFSIIGESNIGDFNFSDRCGFDPRIKLGYAKRGYFGSANSGRIIIGASISLVPRLDRKSDILNDAFKLSYECEWHSGPSGLSGGIVNLKVNLLSIARLF